MDNAELRFQWRQVERRPTLAAEVVSCDRAEWRHFRAYHYMSAELANASRCYLLLVAGQRAAFAAVLNFPHPKRHDIRRIHRVVTLPDWQGIGCGPILIGRLAAAAKTIGLEMRISTKAAAFAASLRRSGDWREVSRGVIHRGNAATMGRTGTGRMGGCFVSTYRWIGAPASASDAAILFGDSKRRSLPAIGRG